MARGMLAGITTGLVVSVLGLGAASLVLEPAQIEMATQDTAPDVGDTAPGMAEPAPATAPQSPDPAPQDATPDDGGPALAEPSAPSDTSVPDAAQIPDDMADPAPETDDTVDSTAPSPSAPEADPDGQSDVPPPAAPADGEVGSADAEATESPADAPAPDAGDETDETPPAAPAAPEAEEADSADAAGVSVAEDTGGSGDPVPDGAPSAAPMPDEPAEAPAPADVPEIPADDERPVILPPVEESAGEAPTDDAPPAVAEAAAQVPAPQPPAETAAPATSDDTGDAPAAPSPDDTAMAEESAPAVVTGRLPSIGDDTATPAAVVTEPALVRNAADFEAPGDRPLLSILLLDTGGDRSGMADLGKLPFPVSIAIDASATDAAAALDFYGAQGAELVTIVPLPEGATPTDVDVSFQAYRPLLEDSVAAMVEAALGFQALGDGAVQVGVNLAETGHGLVSFPSGLNTGHKAAQKEGVAARLVFRDLDSEGQTGPVIRRFLDNAAFRAGNENGVVVVARTRPETVQALLEWSLGTRAESVTLAPISMVLATE